MRNHEVVSPHALLNANGNLAEPGWSRQLIQQYDRSQIKAPGWRIKEWDYYLITNGRWGLALTIADNSYMGMDSVSLLDFEAGWEQTTSPMRVLPMGRTKLPASSEKGHIWVQGKRHYMLFENHGDMRRLTFHMDCFRDKTPIDGGVVLTSAPEDSMVIATPFPGNPRAFYYNQKINCLRAEGSVDFDGKTYRFDPSDSFAVLDWGRGVWTYDNTWYWSSASGLLDGVPFGFNLGYGFGDTSAATENMLFYEGVAHKLEKVTFQIPKKD